MFHGLYTNALITPYYSMLFTQIHILFCVLCKIIEARRRQGRFVETAGGTIRAGEGARGGGRGGGGGGEEGCAAGWNIAPTLCVCIHYTAPDQAAVLNLFIAFTQKTLEMPYI